KYNSGLRWVRADQLKPQDVLAIPKRKYEVEARVFDMAQIVPHYHADEMNVWANRPSRNFNSENYHELAARFDTTARVIGTIVTQQRRINDALRERVNAYLDSVGYIRFMQPVKLNRFIALDGELMRLIGYYVAEGYNAGKANNRQARFAFGAHERAYVEDASRLVDTIFGYRGTTANETPRHALEARVNNHAIARFFETLTPAGARNKRLPEYVLNQTTD